MTNVVYLALSADTFGGSAPSPSAVGGYFVYLVAGLALWVLSIFIAFWIIRAGVRAGVQQLVEQSRQTRDIMQGQAALLNQLVKGQAGAKPQLPSEPATEDAWDKLRGT